MDVKFYMKRDGVDEEYINLESYFQGMRYMQCKGLEDLGKPKNIYTETYADADTLRVYIPEKVKRGATTITFSFAFLGEDKQSVYDAFNSFVEGYKIHYYDTARKKASYMVLMERTTPKVDFYKGKPYMTVDYTFQNLWGECRRVYIISALKLTISKDTIKADGIDEVSFMVTYESNDITSDSIIYVNNKIINGNTFSTNTDGMFNAFAINEDKIRSNTVSFTAEPILELVASHTEVIIGKSLSLHIKLNGNIIDVGNVYLYVDGIFVKSGESGYTYMIYAPETAGIHSLYVKYEYKDKTLESNEIRINVAEPVVEVIEIKAVPLTIKADGIENVVFSATSNGIDITEQVEFYVNDVIIIGNSYSTNKAGTYSVYAKKEDIVSDAISFKATQVMENTLELEGSTNEVTVGKSIMFTVRLNGGSPLDTGNVKLYINDNYIKNGESGTYSIVYAPQRTGDFTAYVEYDYGGITLKSNIWNFTAILN